MKRRKREPTPQFYFHFYLLPEEVEILKRKSAQFHLSRSEYLRTLISYGKIPWNPILFENNGKYYFHELNHIYSNISLIKYNIIDLDSPYLTEMQSYLNLITAELKNFSRIIYK